MPKKKSPETPFGEKLYQLRMAKGLTQIDLAKAIGSTQRAISYYETIGIPPATVIVELAQTLGVTTDELLGLKKNRPQENQNLQANRFWKKFKKVSMLPEKDQRAIIRMVNSLAATKQH